MSGKAFHWAYEVLPPNMPIPDVSDITRQLLQIARKIDATVLVNRENQVIRIRSVQGRPAMQIRRYNRALPEVRVHIRVRGNRNKETEFFAAANLEPRDWEKKKTEGSHRYIGDPRTLVACAERALGTVLHDAF